MVKVSLIFLILVFCLIFIIPILPMLRKYKLIADTFGLGSPITIIVRLVI